MFAQLVKQNDKNVLVLPDGFDAEKDFFVAHTQDNQVYISQEPQTKEANQCDEAFAASRLKRANLFGVKEYTPPSNKEEAWQQFFESLDEFPEDFMQGGRNQAHQDRIISFDW